MSASWGAPLIGGLNGAGVNVGGASANPPVDCPGGIMVFSAAGSFNGATIKLQVLGPDGLTWLDAGAATTLTANGMGVAYLPPCQVLAAVVGGPPSGIFCSLANVVS